MTWSDHVERHRRTGRPPAARAARAARVAGGVARADAVELLSACDGPALSSCDQGFVTLDRAVSVLRRSSVGRRSTLDGVLEELTSDDLEVSRDVSEPEDA